MRSSTTTRIAFPILAVGGVVAVAIVAGVLVMGRAGAPPAVSLSGTPTGGSVLPGWTALPPSPLAAREGATAVWTGSLVLVVGGTDAPPCPPNADCPGDDTPLRDGAAYDPIARTWRRLADAPVPVTWASTAVVGPTVHWWVGGPDGPTFLAYDVAEDAWRILPLPDDAGLGERRLVAVGERIVVYRPTQEHGPGSDLVFEPATGAWAALPADPLAPSFDRSLVRLDDRLVLVGVAAVPDPGVEPPFYRAAVHDLATGEWRRLPDAEIVGSDPTWYAAGGLVVNPALGSADGGAVNGWGRAYSFGGMLDVAGEAWLALPGGPVGDGPLTGLAAAADAFVLNRQGWVLDVGRLAWQALDPLPGAPTAGAAVVGAGDRIVLFGGSRFTGDRGELLTTGWEWAAPSD